jgi:CDP-glucose 4,6-dehydratase
LEALVTATRAFAGKRVLVTGNTGFKGSWLSLWLHDLGADVFGFALPPDGPVSHFEQLGLHRLIDHVDGDVRDLDAVMKAFDRARPDVVIHLAAQPLVRRSYRDPKETFDTNVGGGVNVLEAVRATSSVRALMFATSDKCYRNRETHVGYVETDELGGHDPYSASKAAAELAFASYNDSYFRSRAGFGAASARAGNVIGGGDWAEDRIIPDCIRALANDEVIRIRSPKATRPWQHVLEPLSGYLVLTARLLESPSAFTGSWNFGPAETSIHTVGDVVEAAITHWGSGRVEVVPQDGELHEAGLLSLNCAKAHTKLDWQPRWDFATTMERTVSWYRDQNRGTPAIELTREHIHHYMEARS